MKTLERFGEVLVRYAHAVAWKAYWEEDFIKRANQRAAETGKPVDVVTVELLAESPSLALALDPHLEESPFNALDEVIDAETRGLTEPSDIAHRIRMARWDYRDLVAVAEAFARDPQRFEEACRTVGQRTGDYATTPKRVIADVARAIEFARKLDEDRDARAYQELEARKCL